MIAAAAAVACGSSKPAAPREDQLDAGEKETFVTSAVRCAECHGRIYDEWRTSAHATSRTAPLYRAMVAAAPSHDCESCHAPLAGLVGENDAVLVDQGVTCDVCHTIREVEPKRRGAGFHLAIDDNTKFGPICQGQPPYFHKLGCSTLHQESSFCAACHLLHLSSPAGDIPVFTEYEEWQESPQAAQMIDCQGCHMPSAFAEAATGAGTRPGVSHHGMFGTGAALRSRAITGRLALLRKGSNVEVTATLTNEGAAHAVPSGLPGRRLELRLSIEDPRGRTTASSTFGYGRRLVDDSGHEVPFFRARRQEADTRLMPKQSRTEAATLIAPAAGTLHASLVLVELSPEIAATLADVQPPAELVLHTVSVPFSSDHPLPSSVELAP